VLFNILASVREQQIELAVSLLIGISKSSNNNSFFSGWRGLILNFTLLRVFFLGYGNLSFEFRKLALTTTSGSTSYTVAVPIVRV